MKKIRKYGILPVSYTHLLKGIVEQALAGKCESENNEVRAALQEWLDNYADGEGSKAATAKPVSYTHLDVYKRQVIGSLCGAVVAKIKIT